MNLSPWSWDAASGAWAMASGAGDPASGEPGSDGAPALTVVTWNVWFDRAHQEARAAALLDVLRDTDADVICLQEVTRPFLGHALASEWVRRGYAVSDGSGETVDPYGVLLLSRVPLEALELIELPSETGRRLLVASLRIGHRRLVVGNLHLESRGEKAASRVAQMEAIFPLLRARGDDVVLVGDFNFDSEAMEAGHLDTSFVDLWPALRPGEPGWSMDTHANRMTYLHKQKHKQVRFDRVLARSPQGHFAGRSIRLLGTEAIAANARDVFPSDHFGLEAVVDFPG